MNSTAFLLSPFKRRFEFKIIKICESIFRTSEHEFCDLNQYRFHLCCCLMFLCSSCVSLHISEQLFRWLMNLFPTIRLLLLMTHWWQIYHSIQWEIIFDNDDVLAHLFNSLKSVRIWSFNTGRLKEFYYVVFFALGSTPSVSCGHLVAMHRMSKNNNSVAPYHPHFLSWSHCQKQTADLPGEAGCWVPAERFDRVQSSSLIGDNTSKPPDTPAAAWTCHGPLLHFI